MPAPDAPPLAIDLDGVLGDTRGLWRAWLDDARRVLPLDVDALPDDRSEAAAALDGAGGGNWRVLLERFAEDRAPVFLRPSADVSASLRRLSGQGRRLGVFTDAPAELASVALAHLGAGRRVDAVVAGRDALARLVEALGPDVAVIRSRDDLGAACRA